MTVIVPYRRELDEKPSEKGYKAWCDWLKRRAWLDAALASFPQDKGITFLRVANDGDLANALNLGLEVAETEFVMRFDADDVATENYVEAMRQAIWDADVAYPNMILTDEKLNEIGYHHASPFCPRRLQQANYIGGPSLFRRQKALDVGGFRDLEAYEDWDLWVRMSEAGAKFKPADWAEMGYRQVAGSRNRMTWEKSEELAVEIRGEHPCEDAVATFYYQATPINTYLRAQLPARYLPGVCWPIYQITVGPGEDPEKGFEFPFQRGAAIMQFPGTKMHWLLVQAMQHEGIPVLVETDDNYTVPKGDFMRKAGWKHLVSDKGQTEHSVEGHQRILAKADGVLVTGEHLRRAYSKFNENVWVCPNQVDPEDWPRLVKPDDGIFRVGWFASATHGDDVDLVERALRWASQQDGVEVLIMGMLPRFKFEYKWLPWHDDFGIYRSMLPALDVGLAPITPNAWSLGRSDLKALDYAMGKACPLLSDQLPYRDWTEETSVKAKDGKDFWHKLKYLVEHRDEAREIAQNALEYVLRERTIEGNVWRYEEAIASVTKGRYGKEAA